MTLKEAKAEIERLTNNCNILQIRLEDTMGALIAGQDTEVVAFVDNAYDLALAVATFLGSDDELCFEHLDAALEKFDKEDPFNPYTKKVPQR